MRRCTAEKLLYGHTRRDIPAAGGRREKGAVLVEAVYRTGPSARGPSVGLIPLNLEPNICLFASGFARAFATFPIIRVQILLIVMVQFLHTPIWITFPLTAVV